MGSIDRVESTHSHSSVIEEVKYTPYHPQDTLQSIEIRRPSEKSSCCDKCLTAIFEGLRTLFLRVWRFFLSFCFQRPVYRLPNVKVETFLEKHEIETKRKAWHALGPDKWKEVISAKDHEKGKEAYDEPGSIESFEKHVVPLISRFLGVKTTPELYLKIHEAACWHFEGKWTDTLMARDRVGQFRNKEYGVYRTYVADDTNTDADWQEFRKFKPKLGTLQWKDETHKKRILHFTKFSEKEIKHMMDLMLKQFYDAVLKPDLSKEEKTLAICTLAKMLDWLHPPRDGTSRTDLVLLQKHLTEHIGHPAILQDTRCIKKMRLEHLVKEVTEGLSAWEEASNG